MNQSKIPSVQSLNNQRGEIAFRKHHDKSAISPYLPNHVQLQDILRLRNIATTKIISSLQSQNICLSPFLEIGAEYAQRSTLLVNKFNLSGFALDLSLDSLTAAKIFAQKLNFKKLPLLICADAYHLPFATNSLPFVFCFETLHHFPHPGPIISEALRVTSSHFYFGEEPISQLINLHLWRRDYHLTPLETLLKKLYLLPFLSDIGKSEVDHGILENTFWLDTWANAITQHATIDIKPFFWGPSTHSLNPNIFIKFLLALQGGGISALLTKQFVTMSDNRVTTSDSLLNLLCCPVCRAKLDLIRLRCPKCRQRFVQKKGVYILLPEMQRKHLYNF